MKHIRHSTKLDAELVGVMEDMLTGAVESTFRSAARFEEATTARARSRGELFAPTPPEAVSLKLTTGLDMEEAAAAWVRDQGGEVRSAGPRVLVATLPAGAVAKINQCPWVLGAEAPRRFHFAMDQARQVAGVEAALAAQPRTGNGVIVGVIDSGVDWRHADFRNPDGSTRLEMFAHGSGNSFEIFDSAQINAALGGAGIVPDGDPNGHGTHCASIAAGNGSASGGAFRGVAPGAALAAVRADGLFDTHVIIGIRAIFALAEATNRAAVINMSFGGHLGPHDGTSALENVIALESGPGRIICVAAGNEGNDRIHWQGDLRNGVLEIPVEVRDPGFQFLDVWVPRGDDVDLVVVRPDGVVEDADGSIRQTPFGGYRAMPRLDPINRDQNLAFLIAGGNVGDVWKVRLTPIEVTQGVVHAWAGTETGAPGSILPDSGPEFSLGMPGTEERAIVVGSIVTRNVFEGPAGPAALPGLVVGRLSGFSSHGPTRTGAMKPDIAAPGQVITAALAAGSELATLPQFAARRHPSGQYVTIQGTSMATPFVAGVIALLLEGNSRLTPEEIQQRLRVTARRDTDTGRVWNPGFGFGKLDVATLLDYSQQLDSQP